MPYQQKEEFIKALVEFEDGCKDFYKYQAYFLAATGLAELADCSRASVIVEQIVKWAFGYFNTEKQEWWTFFKPIEEEALATLSKTKRRRAISALVRRRQATDSLGKIGSGSSIAISALMQLISSTQNEYTCWQAVESLKKIDPDNQAGVTALVRLIKSNQNETTRWLATESLKKILRGEQLAVLVAVTKQYLSEETKEERDVL